MTYDLAAYVKAIVDEFPPLTDPGGRFRACRLRGRGRTGRSLVSRTPDGADDVSDDELPTPEQVFWKAIRDGYGYQAATAKQRQAEDDARREQARREPTADVPDALTPQQIIDALVEARGPDAKEREPGRHAFLLGYDAAVDAARRLADYPWHGRAGGAS